MSMPVPRIGVAVIVVDKQKVLIGKRIGSHGGGTWAFPGGHLEFGESVEECAIREVREETDLVVRSARCGPFTNDIFPDERKHYVTLWVIARYEGGSARVCEPDRCEEWRWVHWDQLPDPLFLPIQNLRDGEFTLASAG